MMVAMLLSFLSVHAYDFEADGFAYTITSLTDLTVSFDQVLNKDLTVLNIPETVEYKNKTLTVTSIANEACMGNKILTMISMPQTIVSIGKRAFKNNTALAEINIPESTKNIGSEAFSGCTSISEMVIPVGVTQVENSVFYGCTSLLNIHLTSGIKSIGESAFENSGIRSITLPSSVTSLGKRLFAGTQLEALELPNEIDVIPDNCFLNCTKLCDISFSSSVIGSNAFKNCIALKEISLPSNLITIGDKAFDGCINLGQFTIPSSVTSIEPTILWGCNNIETIEIGKGLSGLPVYATHSYGTAQSYSYSTLGSYYSASQSYKDGPYHPKSDIVYLENVRKFIIDDCEEAFSIKGFYFDKTTTPPFTNTELDYYYVGRPLIDIQSWSSNKGSTGFSVKEIKQGTGRIKTLEISGYCTTVPYFYQKIDTLKLGPNIKQIHLGNIYEEEITKIECQSTLPPNITSGEFPTKVYTDALLYVPLGCKDVYSRAEIWKNFWNIIEADFGDTSSIPVLTEGKDNRSLFIVHDLMGHLVLKSNIFEEVHKLPKGIYVITHKSKTYKIKI